MLTFDMAKVLGSDNRELCFLAQFETAGADLYCWSGMHPVAFDGETWLGVGNLYEIGSVDLGDVMAYRTRTFTLNGLDGSALAGMDESVTGRAAWLWLAARNTAGQIIRDPLLIADMDQETLQRKIGGDGTVSLTLTCSEALPRFDRPTGRKWSQESQQERFAGDEGFYYTQKVARTGLAIDWRPA